MTTPSSSSLFAGIGCLLVASIIYIRKLKANAGNGHLPPGPKPVPVLGNVRDLQAKELWLPAMRWARQYGEHPSIHVAHESFAPEPLHHVVHSPMASIVNVAEQAGLHESAENAFSVSPQRSCFY